MAIATRPKPKVRHKKRKAQHHRQTTAYLKPYWPYLPMVAVVGLGVMANDHWPESLTANSYGLTASAGQFTRIEAITGSQDSWGLVFIIAITAIAAIIFVTQHWFRIQRTLNRGERFVAKHPWLDVALVVICTAGVLLTRAN